MTIMQLNAGRLVARDILLVVSVTILFFSSASNKVSVSLAGERTERLRSQLRERSCECQALCDVANGIRAPMSVHHLAPYLRGHA